MNSHFNFRLISTIILLSVSVLFTTCRKEVTFPTYNDKGNIDSNGGIVKTDDGASVEIPKEALSTNQTISITNTTEGDTVMNNGCRIYELKPDGLTFSDSVIITLPFDDTYIDLSSQEDNYGVGIMVFQDSTWVKLKTKINLSDKTAKVKTIHFSTYIIESPSESSDYFNKNKGQSRNIYNVPYYYQEGKWCAYYSLSMVTKYAVYDNKYKGPFFASMMNEGEPDGLLTGLLFETRVNRMGNRLKDRGIKAMVKHWGNINNLCGYVLRSLNEGQNPVWIASRTISHTVVVTGHDQTGFYINDPSNAFLIKINPSIKLTELSMYHVSYEQFINVLGPKNDIWTESTIVISPSGIGLDNGITLNFHNGAGNIGISRGDVNNSNAVGELDINGKYKPDGYSLINSSTNKEGSFDGSDYVCITPMMSNSNKEPNLKANLHLLIDNKDVMVSSQIDIPDTVNAYFFPKQMRFQLSNLNKGQHIVDVELRSKDSQILYDSWKFDLQIANEFPEPVSDIEGNIYKTVKIGDQIWMAENLKTTKYNDGTTISYGAYCWYNNDIINKSIYGALYNWNTVNTGILCPTGWHVSTDAEWHTLALTLDADAKLEIGKESSIAGGKLKETSTSHWNSPNFGATNESGFTALPGAYRADYSGAFCCLGDVGTWWTRTIYNTYCSFDRTLNSVDGVLYRYTPVKEACFSIRCVKD